MEDVDDDSDVQSHSAKEEATDNEEMEQSDNGDDGEVDNSERESSSTKLMAKSKIKTKETKAGIIYLSTVPPGMNIRQIRDYLSEFGEVNRSFLQADSTLLKNKYPSSCKQKIKNQLQSLNTTT